MVSDDGEFCSKLCRALTCYLHACRDERTDEYVFVCTRYTNEYSYYYDLTNAYHEETAREALYSKFDRISLSKMMEFSYELGRSTRALNALEDVINLKHYLRGNFDPLHEFSEMFTEKEVGLMFKEKVTGKYILLALFEALESIRFHDSILARNSNLHNGRFFTRDASEKSLAERLKKDLLFNYGYWCEKVLFSSRQYLNFYFIDPEIENEEEYWAICIWSREDMEERLNEEFAPLIDKALNQYSPPDELSYIKNIRSIAEGDEDVREEWEECVVEIRTRLKNGDEDEVRGPLRGLNHLDVAFSKSLDLFAREKALCLLKAEKNSTDLVENIDYNQIGETL